MTQTSMTSALGVSLSLMIALMTTASPAAAQAQPDTETIAAATELIITLRMPDGFKLSLPAMLQVMKPTIIQGRPEIERDFDAATPVVLDAMKARVSESLSPIAGIYARNFTASEMRQLVAFYRTPAGQKFLDKSPGVTQEMATIGQSIGRFLAGEMHDRMIEELRKRGQKL